MGRRKERRISAMAASRRVKLDIFAEPPGDSGGSPAQDELGEDINPKHRDESPNSPSSSGKQPENPLLLLGQYSDEELEEQSSQQVATLENPSVVDREQVDELVVIANEDRKGKAGINLDASDEKEHDLDECKLEQIDAIEADGPKQDVSVEEAPLSEAFDVPSSVDVNTSWTYVLHEESGQYYYWNTVTGETSWVVPDVLASGTDLTGGREVVDAEKNISLLVGAKQPNATLDVELNGYERTGDLEEKNEPGALIQEPDDDQKDRNLQEIEEGPDAGQASKCKCNLIAHEDNDLDNDLCFTVVSHGESMLERFISMERSRSQAEEKKWISRYILEVQIRLSDAKMLLSFGSSLLPFWVHSEKKLKELEAAFDAEVCQYFIDETQVVEATDASPKVLGIETITSENYNGEMVSDIEKSYVSAFADISEVLQKEQHYEVADDSVLTGQHDTPVEYLKLDSNNSLEVNIGKSTTAEVTEVNRDTTVQYEEGEIEDVDMDMDVDMEVEDANEPHLHPNPPVESIPLPHEDFNVPPPPGEDWAPPPPLDSEPVPPPPPDDSAESFYPPPPPPDDQTEPSYPPSSTYSQTILPLPYTDQYGFSYPSSSFDYYGQTRTEFPINNTYQQAEDCYVPVPNPSVYYETLSSSYPGTAPIVVNPVKSVSSYDLQEGTLIHRPVVSGMASSVLDGAIGSLNPERENTEVPLSSAGLGGSVVNGGAAIESKGTSIVQIPSSVNISVIKSGPMPSVVAPAITAEVAKPVITSVQPKALRSKKRTISAAPTLRSNKKVSSLVDKWKAAKEEMHEDEEDEPETAYDILEKKRQREIEKWKKQQIASGEAKDNANFQPLGGDWRERVKRKRGQLKKDDKKSPSENTAEVNKQPDLGVLSRDLPSGWQVYWDESSKQVYYGNTITSETTWTRPGK